MTIGRRLGYALLLPLIAVMTALVAIPTLILFSYSLFEWLRFEPVTGPGVDNYMSVFGDPLTVKIATNTLQIAIPTAIGATVGGYVIAYYTVYQARRSRSLMFLLIVTALMASYLVRVYAWRTLLGTNGLINVALESTGLTNGPIDLLLFSNAAVILAEVSLFMPLAALAFLAALGGIPPDFRDAARDLGAGRIQVLRRVTLPLAGPALLSTSALVFFLACGDFVTPVFLGGVDSVTVGTIISQAFGPTADYGRGAALSIFVLLSFALTYLGLRGFMKLSGLLPERPS